MSSRASGSATRSRCAAVISWSATTFAKRCRRCVASQSVHPMSHDIRPRRARRPRLGHSPGRSPCAEDVRAPGYPRPFRLAAHRLRRHVRGIRQPEFGKLPLHAARRQFERPTPNGTKAWRSRSAPATTSAACSTSIGARDATDDVSGSARLARRYRRFLDQVIENRLEVLAVPDLEDPHAPAQLLLVGGFEIDRRRRKHARFRRRRDTARRP